MKLSICFPLFLSPLCLAFQQNEYKVIFERMEIASYNLSFASFAKTHNFKYNRTNAVANMTFGIKQDFVGKLDLEVQAYKLASNEYRFFPIRFSFNFCQYVTTNEFGLDGLYRCGNLTGCPFKKGIARICNWAVDGNKFPPHIPQRSYMFDLKLIYHGIEVVFFQLYVTIKYPEVKGWPAF